MRESPDFVRTSLAASITLGLKRGRFYRNAKLYCINLLIHYDIGCSANCSYCGLQKLRAGRYDEKSFIRVDWPLYPTDEVIRRMEEREDEIERVCISMITRRKAVQDTMEIARRIKERTDIPISFLISPTVILPGDLENFKKSGADKIGVAIDAATPELFDRHRGKGVKGPHKWDKYISVFKEAVSVFGKGNVGSHFIVGLGETEKEMVKAIQFIKDLGGETHLFSFFPEPGSLLENQNPPPIGTYRRIQIARYLIDNEKARFEDMKFNEKDQIIDFGIDITPYIEQGECFMTSGCVGKKGRVACNRPYANERPGDNIRNYPFPPEPHDIEKIKKEIFLYE